MRGLFERVRGCVCVCLAVLGGAAVGSVAAGFNARPPETPELSRKTDAVSAADTVGLRFPSEWNANPHSEPAILAFASMDGSITLFDPRPIYPVPQAEAPAPLAERPAPAEPALRSAAVKTASAAASIVPARRPRSNAVLNDSQIAGIKKRLNLTPEQERYWPAVEAELRKMEYKKASAGRSAQGTSTASVDMSKMDIEGLKSAGFPLVMSFSDDQKRELKSLAHLLGLESVLSTF